MTKLPRGQMSEVIKELASLSPEKRKLIELMLQEEGLDISQLMILPRAKGSNSLPLSFGQQQLWLVDQLEPGSVVYNIPAAIRMQGPLNLAALKQSLDEIVRRHEILRTTFVAGDGQPVQVISAGSSARLVESDLCGLAHSGATPLSSQLAAQEAHRPFDLARGPLIRSTLLRLDEQDHILLLTLHHIVFDAWCMGILIREMVTFYKAFSDGEPSPLAELKVQYADFALWQRQWLQGEVLERELSYWRKQLEGMPAVLELPTDRPRRSATSNRGAIHTLELSRELSDSLEALSRAEAVTSSMLLLAAFQTLLYRYSGKDDIVVGTPIANRNRAETEALIGFFVNMLVMRVDLSGNPSFRELLKQVREVTLEAYAHQDLPFEKLVVELRPERELNRKPLFQVVFAFQNTPMPALQSTRLTVAPVRVQNTTSVFDLVLYMITQDRKLIGSFEYNTDLFNPERIAHLARNFERLLRQVAEDPDLPLLDIRLFADGQEEYAKPVADVRQSFQDDQFSF